MFVRVHMYIHMYTYLYTYVYIHTNTYFDIYKYAYTQKYVYICISHTHTHSHTQLFCRYTRVFTAIYVQHVCTYELGGARDNTMHRTNCRALFQIHKAIYIHKATMPFIYCVSFPDTQGFVASCTYLFRIYTCNTCVLGGWGA